jgi:predicted aspartyl protease
MISGIITANREAHLRVTVLDDHGDPHDFVSVVDTGYNGSLTLPPSIIAALGLRWRRYGHAILADGSDAPFNVYEATIIWDGRATLILVDEMDADSLTGMSLIYGYELTMPVVDGAVFTLRLIAAP